jgi:hypothetical protein
MNIENDIGDYVTVSLCFPKHVAFRLKQKLKFYELTFQDVLGELAQRFLDGDFDDDFKIPRD